VVKEPYCSICESERKTVLHALWGYPAMEDIWRNSKRKIKKCSTEGMNFMTTAENILEKCGLDDFGLFVQLTRQIWYRRNKWVHEVVFINQNVILLQTNELMEAYKRTQEHGFSGKIKEAPDRDSRWVAPTQGGHKANWDVAIDKSKGKVGIGVIIRDEKGQFFVDTSKTRTGILEPRT
jgi:hypothetical protein